MADIMLYETSEMMDVTAPELVEIKVSGDGKIVWVNIDGKCAFRACRIKNLIVEDERPEKGKL